MTNTNLIERAKKIAGELDYFGASLDRKSAAAIRELLAAIEAQAKQIEALESSLVKAQSQGIAALVRIEALQADAERLDYVINNRAYVVSDADCCDGYWLQYVKPDATWVQVGEYESPRTAIDAARKGNV